MEDSTRERLVDGNIWLRGLHMVIFLVAYNIAEAIIVLLSIFQFFCVLITGSANEPLLRFGKNLSVYAGDVFEFLTFNSEIRPFPFEPWPDEEPGGDDWRSSDNKSSDNERTGRRSSVTIDQENLDGDVGDSAPETKSAGTNGPEGSEPEKQDPGRKDPEQ